MSIASVDYDGKEFVIQCPAFDAERARAIPTRKFDNKTRIWRAPVTLTNITYMQRTYSTKECTPAAAEAMAQMIRAEKQRVEARFPKWYRFPRKPMAHQRKALDKAWGHDYFAFLMEMRTGKTLVAISWSSALAMSGEIDTLVVVCPTPIKEVWVDELEKDCPIPYYYHVHEAGGNKKTETVIRAKYDRFKVLIFGIEALSQGAGSVLLKDAVSMNSCAMVLDESSRIKNHQSKRTNVVLDVGKYARKRAILTGTPTTQGLHDLYTQFAFLHPAIIGMKSFYVFQARYCIMGGFENRQIIGYHNADELMDRIKPYSYQVLAKDVINPPEEIHEHRAVDPTSAQKKALEELGDPLKMATTQGDLELEVETVLERMTRYQQIVGGHFPFDKEEGGHGVTQIEGKNPKLEELMQVIEDIGPDHKILIWARFAPELTLIADTLEGTYGPGSVAEYHGRNRATREDERRDFQVNPACRFFVANQSAAGMGLELAMADTHIYYSNTFSYEDRKQSRARTDSTVQKSKNILVIDLIMRHKIDRMIVEALRNKTDIADYVRRELAGD